MTAVNGATVAMSGATFTANKAVRSDTPNFLRVTNPARALLQVYGGAIDAVTATVTAPNASFTANKAARPCMLPHFIN